MTDFVSKLNELEEKILDEFDTVKNCPQNKDAHEIKKNIDNLLIKIEHRINQIKEDIASCLVNSAGGTKVYNKELLMALKTLKEKIFNEFHIFKYYNNKNGNNQTDTKNLDILLFKVKYQIDGIKNDIFPTRDNADCNNGPGDLATSKENALIRMKTLVNLISCHINNLNNNV